MIWLTRAATALLSTLAAIAGFASPAAATEFSDRGRRAQLHFSIRSTGEVDYRTGVKDGGVKWETTRSYEATVEMEASSPSPALSFDLTGAFGDAPASDAAARAAEPPGDVKALQEQLKACPKDDTGCQMRIGMQIMNSPYMQGQSQASAELEETPARYQDWRAVRNGQRTATAAIEESWQSVFYTAGREWDDCTLKGPSRPPFMEPASESPDSPDALAVHIESLVNGAVLVVDASTGASSLRLILKPIPAEEHCIGAVGNSDHETKEHRFVDVAPAAVMPKNFWIEGFQGSSAGNLIASGRTTLKGEQKLTDGGPGFGFALDAMVPYEVEVSWELMPLPAD